MTSQRRALVLELQQLVDLFLVLRDREPGFGVLDDEQELFATESWYIGTGTPPSA